MRKGIRKPVYFPKIWSLDQCFKVASDHGYAGMELIFRSDHGPVTSTTRSEVVGQQNGYRSWQSLQASVTSAMTKVQCAALTKAASGYGITISSLASGYSAIDKPDSPIFMATHEYIANAIERTKWLGGKCVLISFEKVDSLVPNKIARIWVGEILRRLGFIATTHRIALAYEMVWPALYETPDEMSEILEIAGSGYVGVYYDPANVLNHISETGQNIVVTAKPEDWLRAMLHYVKSVHMKDYAMQTGFVDILTGQVNWKVIRQLLFDAGYDDWLIAEIEVEPINHLAAIAKSSAVIDQFILNSI